MQTNFNVYPSNAASPGQWADDGYHDVKSYPAKVAIGFGILCEIVLTNGFEEIQPVQDTGTTGSFLPVLAGVSVYDPAREQAMPYGPNGAPGTGGSYIAGEMVPCARRGRIWGQWDGVGTWPATGQIRVLHSSTGAFPQGVFTMAAASTTVGHEIDLVPVSAPNGPVIGIEPDRAQASYTDGFGNSISIGIVSLNLA